MHNTDSQFSSHTRSVLDESPWEDDYRDAYAAESGVRAVARDGIAEEVALIHRAMRWTVAIGIIGITVVASSRWWMGSL